MKIKGTKLLYITCILAMLVAMTVIFALYSTFAGSPQAPDITATYTQNSLSWSKTANGDGTVDLNIFGDPAEGEQYPTVDPFSRDTYYLRLKNDVTGDIAYNLYLYCENNDNIPLEFTIDGTDGMSAINSVEYPSELNGTTVLSAYRGIIGGKNLKDIKIDWQWVSASDESDTQLGNLAVTRDLLYKFSVLIVIEDNNSYSSGGDGGGTSRFPVGTDTVKMLHRAYVLGRDTGYFEPGDPISRAEVAAIFARIVSNYDENAMQETSTGFEDVYTSSWYAKYISRAETKGLIEGYNGKFRPDDSITRAEFVTICVRYLEKSIGKSARKVNIDFKDLSETHWAWEYIEKAYGEGYITGYPDGTLKPDADITRAEAVTVVNRLLGRKADKEYIDNNLDNLIVFPDVEDNGYWAYYDIMEAANFHYCNVEYTTAEKWMK